MSLQHLEPLEEDLIWSPVFETSIQYVSAQLLELASDRSSVGFCSVYVMDEYEMPFGTLELARDLSTGEVCGLLLGEITGVNKNGDPVFAEPQVTISWISSGDEDPEDAIIERMFVQRRHLH